MNAPANRHQEEIQRNRKVWESKPVLRDIYRGFYDRVLAFIDPQVPGRVVEIGAGIGNLKTRMPEVIATDLFAHPWLDLVCSGYHLGAGTSDCNIF